jgi:hypothetical protein
MKINALPWSTDLTFLVTQQPSRNYDLHCCQQNFIICVRMPLESAAKKPTLPIQGKGEIKKKKSTTPTPSPK